MRVLRVVRGSATTAAGTRAAGGGAKGRQRAPQRPASQPASPRKSAAVASLAHSVGVHSIEQLLRLLSAQGLDELEASLAAMQQGQQQPGRAATQQEVGAGGQPPLPLLLPLPASLL